MLYALARHWPAIQNWAAKIPGSRCSSSSLSSPPCWAPSSWSPPLNAAGKFFVFFFVTIPNLKNYLWQKNKNKILKYDQKWNKNSTRAQYKDNFQSNLDIFLCICNFLFHFDVYLHAIGFCWINLIFYYSFFAFVPILSAVGRVRENIFLGFWFCLTNFLEIQSKGGTE